MRNQEDGKGINFENIIVVPPDGGWGWVVVLAAFYCIFVMDGIANTYGLFIPVFEEEFDASMSEVSFVNSLFTGFYFLFGPIASSLSNRFGFRAVIITGSILSAFGIGISVFTTSIEHMFLTYGFVGGFGFSLMYINVVLTVGFYFERWRALATGITVSASGAGSFSFAPAVQLALRSYTWKHVFLGYAGLVLFCSAVALCFRPLTPVHLRMDTGDSFYPSRISGKGSRIVYPTAAEATNVNSFLGSRASVSPNKSLESFEVGRLFSKEYRSLDDLPKQSSSNKKGLNEIASALKSQKRCRCCACVGFFGCWKKPHGLRPLYRDDIFFEGSLSQLPVYERCAVTSNRGSVVTTNTLGTGRLSRISNRSLFYNMSVSRLPTTVDVMQEKDRKCHLCPERLTRVLRTMFDFRIVKLPKFFLFLVSTSFLSLVALVPVQFSYVRAINLKIMSENEASLMLSAMGITNTIGRIACGLIGSIRCVNIMLLHVVFISLAAFINTAIIFLNDKIALYTYASLYGFTLAEQGSLRSVILVHLVGLQKLTNAFGILLLFLGIFTIAGMPLAGLIYELTMTYDSVFVFSSLTLLVSAGFCVPVACPNSCKPKKRSRVRTSTTSTPPPNPPV